MNKTTEPQGCLAVIIKLLGGGAGRETEAVAAEFPYQKKEYLLSVGERVFFQVLQVAVGADFLLFSKVRLADLVLVRSGTEKRQSFLNRIQSKHVDFVLCSRDAVRPVLVVELDDASHDREDRQDRDAFVDSALRAAGLPILHVRARSQYSAKELRSAIDSKILT